MKKMPENTFGTEDPTQTLAAIGPVARSSVVDAVADRLRNEILAGRIAAGSRLPSERELSLALGVNRLTLRAALARLEAMGLVSTRHGSGTEVVSWRERAGLEALPMVMGSLVRGEPAWIDLLNSLLEVRKILVSEAVAMAATRHRPEDILAMQRAAADQTNHLHDPMAFAQGDLLFLRTVVRAAQNVGFELILNSFAHFPEEQPDTVAELYDRMHDSVLFYGAVIELVRAGDPDAARNTIRNAFTAMDAAWLARHGHQTEAEGRRAKVASTTKNTPRGTAKTGKGKKG